MLRHAAVASVLALVSASFAAGHSAGAHLAALVCTDGRYLKAEGLPPVVRLKSGTMAAPEGDHGPWDSSTVYAAFFTSTSSLISRSGLLFAS